MCVGVVGFFVGLLLFGVLVAALSARKDVLVDMPISLARGKIVANFVPNISTRYNLRILLETKPNDENLVGCLLGSSGAKPTENYPVGCGNALRVVSADWKLRSDGLLQASSLHPTNFVAPDWHLPTGMGGRDADLLIGHFDLASGTQYVLEMSILNDGGKLNPDKPRLVLEIADNEGEVIVAQLCGMLCILIVLTGFGIAIGSALLVLRRRESVARAS